MNVIILDMGDDVKGEKSWPGFEKKIELLSFSHGDVTDRAPRDYMTLTRYVDSVTPVLHRAAMEAKVFPRVEIIVGRIDDGRVSALLKYTLKNVLVSSVAISGGSGDVPVETVTLRYNSISWDYSFGER